MTSKEVVAMSIAVLFALVGAQAAEAALASTTFDADLEGWTSNTPAQVRWAPTWGNPGGYAKFVDATAAVTWVLAPSEFLGDWSGLDGVESILFDHKLIDVGEGIEQYCPYTVVISGPGGRATWQGDTPDGPTGWVGVAAPLVEAGWTVNNGSWGALLGNVDELRIRMELVQNTVPGDGDIAGLDNIVLTPEPTSLSLLLLAASVVIRRRK
jgi:hypothetical protein